MILGLDDGRAGYHAVPSEVGRAEPPEPLGYMGRRTGYGILELLPSAPLAQMRLAASNPIDRLLVRITRLPGSKVSEAPDAHAGQQVHTQCRCDLSWKPERRR
jgi:hypothetical protein